MKLSIYKLSILVGIAVLLTLSGCSDFDEMKSQRALIEAEKLLEKGDDQHAEQALILLVAQYPNTQAGEVAHKHLFRIKQQRELREREAFSQVLDSYRQVLSGYQALYAQFPDSVSMLDESGYFFDSSYLDEITPDGYQVYLWLKEDGSGYRAWSIAADKKSGYTVSNLSSRLAMFKRDDMLARLNLDFQVQKLTDKLIILRPR